MQSTTVSRRGFVAGAAVLGAAATASTTIAAPSAAQANEATAPAAETRVLNPQSDAHLAYTTDVAPLYEPLQIGTLTLKNRYVKSPAGSDTLDLAFCAENGRVNDGFLDYYSNFAKGGAALVFMETAIPASSSQSRSTRGGPLHHRLAARGLYPRGHRWQARPAHRAHPQRGRLRRHPAGRRQRRRGHRHRRGPQVAAGHHGNHRPGLQAGRLRHHRAARLGHPVHEEHAHGPLQHPRGRVRRPVGREPHPLCLRGHPRYQGGLRRGLCDPDSHGRRGRQRRAHRRQRHVHHR